jgi:hypothetical protein
VALVLTGCGADSAGPGSTAAGPVEPVSRSAPAQGAVRVGLFEWAIVTAPHRVSPGRVKLLVTNTGGTEHDLVVKGRAGRWETPTLEPGDQVELTVTARPGETLDLWCAEPGHRAQGMHTVLRVAG